MILEMNYFLFDLDGTLIDSRRDLGESVRFAQRTYGYPLSDDATVGSFIGDGIGKLAERALPGLPESQIDEAVNVLKTYYRAHCLDHTTIYPGAVDVLESLGDKKMALVTNKPERVTRVILDRLGLTKYFPVILGGDTLSDKKPHPAPLFEALKQLSGTPAEAVMIGDSAVDIEAGRRAGVKTVGILSNIGDQVGLKASNPDVLVESISDIISAHFRSQ